MGTIGWGQDCDEGYTEINGECYYQSDLEVLQLLIDNSSETINMDMDINNNGVIEPLELGEQEWEDRRISQLYCSWVDGSWKMCEVSGPIPVEIGNLVKLTVLDFYGNNLSGTIPSEIGALELLEHLKLTSNQLSGDIPQEIWNLTNLTHLQLSSNQLSGEIPSEIGNLIQLETLTLGAGNQFSGTILDKIENLVNLSWIGIEYVGFTGEIPNYIGEFTNLVGLILHHNQLTGEVPDSLWHLTNISRIELGDNQLTGELPEYIGYFENLQTLYLHNTGFSGLIPESICDLDLNWDFYWNNLSSCAFCPPYPECIEDYIGEQDTSECIEYVHGCTDLDACNYDETANIDDGSCEYDDAVTLSNQWSDGYHYDFTYTLGELKDYEGELLQQIAQKEITSLTVSCQETGQIWAFDSNAIARGNGNHDFSILQERVSDFLLPERNIANGVLLGIDTYATGNYHSLWFSVTAIDDEGNEFTHDNYVDTNPYGWNLDNEIIFPDLYFTEVVDYNSLYALYAEGSFPVASITYQIGENGYYNEFECDGTCQGSLSANGCGNSVDIELHEGSNLMSFSLLPEDSSVGNVLSDNNILAIAGEGEAALNTDNGWLGSLATLQYENGYWLLLNETGTLHLTGIKIQENQLYTLHAGNNLISYPLPDCGTIDEVLPDDVEECIYAIAGEGVATLNTAFGWVGSLASLCQDEGYWFVNICDEIQFTFDEATRLARNVSLDDPPYTYHQSSQQAFYFIESIENIESGEWILVYNDNIIIGARQWNGSIIDVPVMGNDGSDGTMGYIQAGSIPVFKVLRDGKFISLNGNIPGFENNQIYVLASLSEAITLPKSFGLDRAYPNPFNPSTTLSFALPKDSNVILEVYNINGRIISKLIDNYMKAGYHSIIWNADRYSSGLYFIKMKAGSFLQTQKLMLIK